MALTFPVPVADFADELPVAEVRWSLREFYMQSGTAGGRLLRAQLAEPLWAAEISLYPMRFDCAYPIIAKIRRIGLTGQFNLYDPRRPYPRFDNRDGSKLDGYTVKIDAVGTRALRLKGLPDNYQIRVGDMISVSPSGGGKHLYEASDFGSADSGGTTLMIEVTPPPRNGLSSGDSVDLKKPAVRMMFESFDTGMSDRHIASGITLQAIEVR